MIKISKKVAIEEIAEAIKPLEGRPKLQLIACAIGFAMSSVQMMASVNSRSAKTLSENKRISTVIKHTGQLDSDFKKIREEHNEETVKQFLDFLIATVTSTVVTRVLLDFYTGLEVWKLFDVGQKDYISNDDYGWFCVHMVGGQLTDNKPLPNAFLTVVMSVLLINIGHNDKLDDNEIIVPFIKDDKIILYSVLIDPKKIEEFKEAVSNI